MQRYKGTKFALLEASLNPDASLANLVAVAVAVLVVVVVVVWRETQHLTVLTVAADLGRLMRVTVTGKRDSRRLGGTKRLEKLRD